MTSIYFNLLFGVHPVYIGQLSLFLRGRLKTICAVKEKQASKHGGDPSNTIIFVISDLDEMYEPWLNHDKFEGTHPIMGFVLSRKFPTVIFSPGTVYEPPASTLDQRFGALQQFDWEKFKSMTFEPTVSTS